MSRPIRTSRGLLSPSHAIRQSHLPIFSTPQPPTPQRKTQIITIFAIVFTFVMFCTRNTEFVAFSPPPPSHPAPAVSTPSKPAANHHVPQTPIEYETVVISPETQSILPKPAVKPTVQKSKTGMSSWTTPEIPKDADWSKYAIVQYATNMDYLCNSLQIFDSLRKFNTRADLVLFYPEHYAPVDVTNPDSKAAKLIMDARDTYGVKLHPIKVSHREVSETTWADSYTKLMAFTLTNYNRVLSIDSDGVIMQNLDELFFSPPATVAAPLAYWLLPEQKILSSQLMLISPTIAEVSRVLKAIEEASPDEYDMEIINKLYGDSAVILPHRPYDMLTAEFRRKQKTEWTNYLGSDDEEWNAIAMYNEAKFMHFSDWPVLKPWAKPTKKDLAENAPKCRETSKGDDCSGRDLWVGLYRDFLIDRSRVCKIPPPKWY